MTYETLWAGWRSSYIATISEAAPPPEPRPDAAPEDGRRAGGGGDSCVFCGILAGRQSNRDRCVVWRGRYSAALLNAYPYATGHLLVMPVRHVGDLEELGDEEAADLWSTVRDGVVALKSAYQPGGLNIGVNLGRAAGAGVPGHLHVHALPRWVGDTSFVTAVASLRVMPEPLGDTWDKLSAAWPSARDAGAAG